MPMIPSRPTAELAQPGPTAGPATPATTTRTIEEEYEHYLGPIDPAGNDEGCVYVHPADYWPEAETREAHGNHDPR